jgi:sulfite exporter TauE/SafE
MMPPEYTWVIAFLAGLLGSGHCVGMCGGLVSAFFLKMGRHSKNPAAYAAYHGARVSVYVVAGAAAGAAGLLISAGSLGVAQGMLMIVAGLVVILLGLDLLGVGPLRGLGIPVLPTGLLNHALRTADQRGPLAGALLGGTINGFMPCSLTLAVAVQATTAGGPLPGAVLMFAFGLGTLPSMLTLSLVLGRLGCRARGRLMQAAALCVIALGMGTLYQGASYFRVMQSLLGDG